MRLIKCGIFRDYMCYKIDMFELVTLFKCKHSVNHVLFCNKDSIGH